MPNLTSSSFTNGTPSSATEATADNDRPVNPLCEADSSVEKTANDGQLMSLPPLHYFPLQIAQPRKQRKRKVSRQLWPVAKSALITSIPKGRAAAQLPSSLPEVKVAIKSLSIKPPTQCQDIMAIGSVPNADNSNVQQALAPSPTSGSSSSSSRNTKPERFALRPSPSPDIDSLRGPSGFRTPAVAITHNLSEPPQLARGKKRSRFNGDEMSPTECHRLGRRRIRAVF